MGLLDKVHPELKKRILALIALAKADGFDVRPTQGLRTVEEQNALYAQGRTKPGKKVTNANGGQSNHNFGCAVDLGFYTNGQIDWTDSLYNHIGKWASKVGLDWGGNWKTIKDRPHVELPNLPKPSVLFDIYKKGGLEAVWKSVGNFTPTTPEKPATTPSIAKSDSIVTTTYIKSVTPNIQRGDKGESVKVIQQALVAKGFLRQNQVDADFGAKTELAVQHFQLSVGLVADGIVGKATRTALGI